MKQNEQNQVTAQTPVGRGNNIDRPLRGRSRAIRFKLASTWLEQLDTIAANCFEIFPEQCAAIREATRVAKSELRIEIEVDGVRQANHVPAQCH